MSPKGSSYRHPGNQLRLGNLHPNAQRPFHQVPVIPGVMAKPVPFRAPAGTALFDDICGGIAHGAARHGFHPVTPQRALWANSLNFTVCPGDECHRLNARRCTLVIHGRGEHGTRSSCPECFSRRRISRIRLSCIAPDSELGSMFAKYTPGSASAKLRNSATQSICSCVNVSAPPICAKIRVLVALGVACWRAQPCWPQMCISSRATQLPDCLRHRLLPVPAWVIMSAAGCRTRPIIGLDGVASPSPAPALGRVSLRERRT